MYKFFTSHFIAAQESRAQASKQRAPGPRRGGPVSCPCWGPACLAGLRGSCMQPASQCHLDRCLGSLWAPPGCPDPGLRLGLEQGRRGCYWPWLNCRNHSAIELPSGQPPLAWKHLVGSTRSRYPGRQVSHSVGSLTGSTAAPEAVPGTGLVLRFSRLPQGPEQGDCGFPAAQRGGGHTGSYSSEWDDGVMGFSQERRRPEGQRPRALRPSWQQPLY